MLVIFGCGGIYGGPPSTTGSARIVARTQALSAGVAQVNVTVTAADLATPITAALTLQNGQWEAVVANIPAGNNRTFAATALDASGTALYQGQTTGVSLAPGATALVEIVLQEISPPPPHDNTAPVIDGVTVSKDQLALSETVSVGVAAHDPNAGDTLTYRWSASDGTFADPSAASTNYTAPSTAQIVTFTITVSDQDGAKATQSFTVIVGMPNADVTVTFNDWPSVTRTAVESSPVVPGQSTQVSAVASDPNGDAITYAWTATDGSGSPCGTFDDATVATPVFTVGASETTPGSCLLSVAVSDGKGGTGNGSIGFGLGLAGPVTYGTNGPSVISAFQSATTATPNQQVTLRIDAADTTGGAVTFSWLNTVGSLSTQTVSDPNHQSEVIWTAPACLAAGELTQLQVTVTDAASNHLTLAFPVSGPGACMPLVGGVSTASVGSAGAELVSTTTNVTLAIPAQSLSSSTPISVAPSAVPAPAGATSGVYDFQPAGTVFAHPITVRIPLPDGVSTGNVYWRRHAADGTPAVDGNGDPIFDNVGGTVENGYLVAQISHFSEAYVGPAQSARTVSGSKVVTYENPNLPILNLASDFSTQAAPSALVYSDGGYVELPGTGAVDGTFIIPGVPNGEYMLHLGTSYLVTSNDAIDLGSNTNGRPDSVAVSNASQTLLTMNFSNANPFSSTDSFELVSAEAGNCWFDFQNWLSAGGANVGDTSFTMSLDFAVQYCGLNAGLIQGSKGDSVVVGQLVQQTSDAGVPVQVMQQIAVLPPFDMVQGAETTVPVAFETLPSQRSANYTVLGSQFRNALLDDAGTPWPTVAPNNAEARANLTPSAGPFVDIEGVGGTKEHGQIGNTLDLALVYPSWNSGDLVTGGMNYGVPSSGTWGVFTGARYTFWELVGLPCPDTTGCQADGHTLRINIRFAGMERDLDTDLQPSGTIAPSLGPVSASFINGMPMSARHTGFGTTPTLSWSPPTLGTPDEYRVAVYHVYPYRDGNGNWATAWRTVGTFTTPHTSITLPPGILVQGEAYMFNVQALQTGLANPQQAPYRMATNNSYSGILTDLQYP